MTWLEVPTPDRKEPALEEFSVREDYPDQSFWVQQQGVFNTL